MSAAAGYSVWRRLPGTDMDELNSFSIATKLGWVSVIGE
jgi:hypothetical protein